jgi:hypothetical protein
VKSLFVSLSPFDFELNGCLEMDKRTNGDVANGTKKQKLTSMQPQLKKVDLKPFFPPTPFITPAPSGSIKCNPFTYGMLSTQFFLCKECRSFLANTSVSPKDDGTIYLTLKMCGTCKDLNGKTRAWVKETMKKDWPSNKNAQTGGGQGGTKNLVPPPTKLTPVQHQKSNVRRTLLL